MEGGQTIEQSAIAEPKKKVVKKATKDKIKLSKKALDQIATGLKKYRKIIEIAKSKNLNESDTSSIIYDMLAEMFGYEKMFDITTEYKIKWQFCDYGIRINDKLKFLIEVKQVGVELNDNHIYQASSYAWNEWVNWVILTNLRQWQIYYLSFGVKIEHDLVLSVDFLGDEKPTTLIDKIWYIHKESFSKDALQKIRAQQMALSPQNVKKVLLGKLVISKIRNELSKLTKMKVSEVEIVEALEKMFKC